MTRRSWLQRSLCGTIAGASLANTFSGRGPCHALADDDSKPAAAPVTFGFSLYGMRALPLDHALKACEEIGYDAVELVANDGWPCDPARLSTAARTTLRGQLVDHRLALTSIMENLNALADDAGHRKNLDRLKAAADLGHELSPRSPPVVETILGGKPDQWNAVKGTMASRLAEWARVAESAKTVVTVKPHVAGALHTPDDALWLVEEVASPWLRLVYDFSHYRLRGLDLRKSLEMLLPQTAFIHIKDAKGTPASFNFLLPGEGDTDYATHFDILKKSGWKGSVVVEVSGQIFSKPGYDPRQAARSSYERIAPVMKQSGLRAGRG
ncbi:MAG: sugar phosphate isomerase/epimerase [Planctomycetaceae bacterium]|nr:sugar phosphate isomerase/epimerase [Planctomycetaceae bacterium]